MRANKENPMFQDRLSPTAPPAVAPPRSGLRSGRRLGRARRASLATALCGLTLAGVVTSARPAAADLVDQQGQQAGLAIQAVLYACSAVSIGGNAANIAMKHPQRGWMYSGFVCGFINTVTSPVMLIFFRNAEPPYGVTAGAIHGALGITNLGLAIYNGVLWHRAQTAGKEPPKIALLPMLGRDSLGGSVVGLTLSMARF